MKRLISSITLSAFLFSNVASAATADLPTPFASTLPIELRLTQQEIAVEVPNNGAVASLAVGGILGALVGAAINKASVANAEKRVAEIRNQMIDYDFSKQFESAFREKAALEYLGPKQEIKVSKNTLWAEISDKTAKPGKDILVINPSYSLSNKFDEVNVRMSVMLVDLEAKSNGKIKFKLKHSRNYAYSVLLQPGVRQSASAGAEDVALMGKDQLVAMINTGIDGIVEVFNISLSPEGKAKLAKGGKSAQYTVGEKRVRGMLFAKNGDGRDVFFQKGLNSFFVIGQPEAFTAAAAKTAEVAVQANAEVVAQAPDAQVVPAYSTHVSSDAAVQPASKSVEEDK